MTIEKYEQASKLMSDIEYIKDIIEYKSYNVNSSIFHRYRPEDKIKVELQKIIDECNKSIESLLVKTLRDLKEEFEKI